MSLRGEHPPEPDNRPIIDDVGAPAVGDWANPKVNADVATRKSSSKPVLFTVPCRVIASPPSVTSPRNAFSFSAGLDVRNGLAMVDFLAVAVVCAANLFFVRARLQPCDK